MDKPETKKEAVKEKSYSLQKGDTFVKLSKKFNVSVEKLTSLNKDIKLGDKLVLA